jgi:hypothetical protein
MIYIVLLNYNGTADTLACLESLEGLTTAGTRTIVVDNASADNALGTIRGWAQARGRETVALAADELAGARPTDALTLIASPDNLGFAGGNNLGVRLALADPACTHVWLLNNDTVVDAYALDALVARMAEDPAIGLCGSTLLYYDDRATTQALGGAFNALTGRPRQIGTFVALDNLPPRDQIEAEMDYVIGASMLASRRFLDEVGLLSERYFLYCEEIDWATRGKRFRLGWAPGSLVWHKEGGSIGTSQRARPSDTAIYYMYASTLRFVARFHPLALPMAAARVAAIGLRFAAKRDSRAAAVVGLAIADVARGRSRRGPIRPRCARV